jgi:3D (Asp-Asp-Asp) domain-containing protein
MKKLKVLFLSVLFVANFSYLANACENKSRMLEVTATAYTSSVGETDSTPTISAWGDRLKPGMRVIAVSRDLLAMGVTHGTLVQVEGFDKYFIVLDKMNKRWTKKIDLYMGNNKRAALNWGKKKVNICWKYQ